MFDRLVPRIVADEGYGRELAERIMDQALVFLAACAQDHGAPIAPSKLVDVGWHTFILHTRDYADFCQRVAGRFIHHVPDEDPITPGAAAGRRNHTIDVLEHSGFEVDTTMWLAAGGANCNTGDGGGPGECTTTGPDGNENQESKKPGPSKK